MFFQSKKKRLWRARVTESAANSPTTITTIPNQQQLQRLHQRPPHLHPRQQQYHQQQRQSVKCSRSSYSPISQDTSQLSQLDQSRSSYDSNDYDGHESDKLMETDACQARPRTMLKDQKTTTNGCCYESCGENSTDYNDEECDQTMSLSSGTSMNPAGHHQQQQRQRRPSQPITSMAFTMAATANVFRNCCGGGCMSSDSNGSSTQSNNSINNNNYFDNVQDHHHGDYSTFYTPTPNEQKKMFLALYGKLKESQLITLLEAVENRNVGGANGAGGGHQPDCVLVPRGLIMGEEPNVIACRLWFWPDLRSSSELKRIPSCPNEKDRVYVCCNPTHWSRLCMPDTPPPPYHLSAMDRLKPEGHGPNESVKGGENTCNSTSSSRGTRGQFPGSLTTDGEGAASPSTTWCQLAYWELAQRVGGRFPVESSSVNIFSDQPRGDGMCLKTLAEQKQTATPSVVLKARQKIGLGITLSQEADGVWLYNRSSVPVFVHSPTLNDIEYWFHVSKVPPGYCLKAFDNYRARTNSLVWPPQIAGAQTGPVDTNSMRISFAKGWGPNYSRQDVTACPCWLEVLFTRR